MPIIGMLFHPMYMMINTAVVGQMHDPVYLAGLGLGSLTCGIMLISFGTSFALVTSSLTGPAFGAGDYRFCRVILNRQLFLNTCVFAVIAVPIAFIPNIYTAIGQDQEVAKLAAKYVWYVAPGVYFSSQGVATCDLALSMGYTKARLVSNAFATFVHAFLIYLFIYQLDWGFEGVCIATSIQFLVRWIGAVSYLTQVTELKDVDVSFFSSETFSNIGFQFNLGCMTLLMGIWSWWAFDIFTLICSYLSVEAISAQTIMRSLGLFTFMIPVGFNSACKFLIGSNIGRGCIKSILYYYKMTMTLSAMLGLA